MEKYLKTYRIELVTQSPVFIGDGQSLSKKEYVRKGKKIYVPNLEKLYQYIAGKGKVREFETFMLDSVQKDLGRWMDDHRIPTTDYERWGNYALDIGNVSLQSKGAPAVNTCMKDVFGCPYIPGSSLKGMLRTVLQAYSMRKNEDKYLKDKNELEKEAEFSTKKRKEYLKNQEESLNNKVFRSLARDTENWKNAVNDIMSCIHISDSKPLNINCLTVCQKIDISVNGNRASLGSIVARECIRPNTKIEFDLTITKEFPYSIEDITAAIKLFSEEYDKNFFSRFNVSKLRLQRPSSNTIWLGGGVGYVSKTVVYPFLGYNRGLKTTSHILQKTVFDGIKKHGSDVRKGASPHMLKCTEYEGQVDEFGRCRIEFKEMS